MKLPVLLLALLFAAINISMPSAERELNLFSPETSTVSLNDVVDFSDDERDGETESHNHEVEETEFFPVLTSLHLEMLSGPFHIDGPLKVFLSSYSFSIFIPPLS